MSVNAAFSIFKPNALYRNLSVRDDASQHHHQEDVDQHPDDKLRAVSEDVDDLDDDPVLRDVDDDVGLLSDQVRDLTAEKAALQTQLEQRDALAQQLEREKQELTEGQQVSADRELSEVVAKLAAEKTELQNENETLQQRINALAAEIAQAMAAADAARAKAEAASADAETTRTETEVARAVAESARAEADSARAEVETAKADVAAAKAEVEVAKAEVEAARADVETAKAEVELVKTEAARAEAQAVAVAVAKSNDKTEVDDEVVALINALTTERDRLLKQNETLARDKDELERRTAELESQPRVDDELATLVSGMATKNEQLQKQNDELQVEVDEVYDLMDQMNDHVEALELHQHALVAYVNKVCNDMKNVKRRGVWQKIEYDKERQLLVEELYQWKRETEKLKATEKDAVSAAEATAAWELACLNQTIEQLQGEVLAVQTELDAAKEELSRRGGSAEEMAETEQMLEALQELALDLKTQVDESNTELDEHRTNAAREIRNLQDALQEMKQRAIKDSVAHDKERQELMEELLMWKNRALEGSGSAVEAPPSEPESATVSSTSTEDVREEQDEHGGLGHAKVKASQTEHELSTTVELPEDDGCELPDGDESDNQAEHEVVANAPTAKDLTVAEKPPVSTSSEASNQLNTITEESEALHHDANDKESLNANGADASNHVESFSKSKPSNITDMLEQEDEDDHDVVPEPTLASPKRDDSILGYLRSSFSFRPRTESSTSSLGQEPESTPLSRSRANSTASSTTSTSSSTKRIKAKAPPPPPVTQFTRNDFLGHPEPLRMNSFKHFL